MTEKNIYRIHDLCETFNKSRATIWRWREKQKLPKPDIDDGANPVWFKNTLVQHMPNFPV